MITTEKYNELLREYIETNPVNNTAKAYLYDARLVEMQEDDGCTLIEFDADDIAELLLDRMQIQSVTTFQAVRGAYSKFFDWLLAKGIVSINPCLQLPLSLETFTNYLSYNEALKPLTYEEICNAIDLNADNKHYFNIVFLSIYEGVFSSYKQLAGLKFDDVDFDAGIIHTKNGDKVPSKRLLDSIKNIKNEREFVFKYRTGTLIFVDSGVIPYIYINKKDIVDFSSKEEAEHRIHKSIHKQTKRFNERWGTDLTQQRLWESGIINRVIAELGEEEFVEMMLNPTTDKDEHERLNAVLNSIQGWGFDNKLAIDKFKTNYRYHAVRLKRELCSQN